MNLQARKKRISYLAASLVLTLWIVWLENPWFFLLFIPITDLFFFRRINWLFWRIKHPKTGKTPYWVDFIDVVLIAFFSTFILRVFFFEAYTIPSTSMEKTLMNGDYLFVSKIRYGPKMPVTPLAFPFSHNTLPLTKSTPSYLTWLEMPYKRLKGISEIKRQDVVVFHFPDADTVIRELPGQNYHAVARIIDRQEIRNRFNLRAYPVDKRENYVKRCVAIPGDTLQVIGGHVYVNEEFQDHLPTLLFDHVVTTNGMLLEKEDLKKIGYAYSKLSFNEETSIYEIPIAMNEVDMVKDFKHAVSVKKFENTNLFSGVYNVFPFREDFLWNEDFFGPIIVPGKGMKISLTKENIHLYSRIIADYEKNRLQVVGESIFINGKSLSEYTFQMDYYFMVGDNRHNSSDSRFWGFVPEDHVVGKATIVWFSINRNRNFPMNLRLGRILKRVR